MRAMIDYIKADLPEDIIQILLQSEFLEFKAVANCETGELQNNSFAIHNGLQFNLFTLKGQNGEIIKQTCSMQGSLHKYYHDGVHNHDDFNEFMLELVLEDLEQKFGITPEEMRLKQIELGVNIEPPVPSLEILRYSLLHKRRPFKSKSVNRGGNYMQVRYQNHIIKLYDKQKQYKHLFPELRPTLRFEIKFLKMRMFHDLGIYNLGDLLEYGLSNFEQMIEKEWNNVLFYEKRALHHTIYRDMYSNLNYWLDLNDSNFKFHRSKLNGYIDDSDFSVKNEIRDRIKQKWRKLSENSVLFTSYDIGIKKTV